MHSFKFCNKFRLSSRKCFSKIFKSHKKDNLEGICILSSENKLKYPRIGIIISKKYVKLSHDRNRIKRLIRESFRLNKNLLPSMDFLLLIKSKNLFSTNFILLDKLKKIWIYYQKF